MNRSCRKLDQKDEPYKSQISDAEAFAMKFIENIERTHQLKSEVYDKLTLYQQKLELGEHEQRVLKSELNKQVEFRVNLENENQALTEKIALLTKENVETKTELQRTQENVTHLMDDLKLKEIRLDDLEKENRTLLEERASFNKNFNDRLKSFINGISFSDTNDSLMTDDSVKMVETNNKRPHGVVDLDTSIHEENPKRTKTDDDPLVSSTDTNDISTNVPEDQPVEESQPDLDDRIPSRIIENVKVELDDNADFGVDCITDCEADSFTNDTCSAVTFYENPIQQKQRNSRKNIKKVMDFENLTEGTKLAYQQEKERNKQYYKRLQKYSETCGRLPGELNKLDNLWLDIDLHTKTELLVVDKRLSTKLKPHQCEGVKFMWDACFESIEKLQLSDGSGCILSHCMGLGKTLQVIALVHTLLAHSRKTGVEKVLIICPVNVILNWVDEFNVWLKDFRKEEAIKIYELATCSPDERRDRIKLWHTNGGVLIIGYKMFQKMYQNMERKKSSQSDSYIFYYAVIDPGADLVVCDEGHLLKNPTSQLSLAINKIRTLRRIVLTGTPLQNNLKEYFSMVEFVKPRLLGTEKEFNNRFIGPITNGQFVDSTDEDIKLMKHRAYILHKLLDGCVHRRDYSVLAKFLPPKQEYVLFIRLTKQQIALYKFYMGNFAETKPVADMPALRRICNHPKVLADADDRRKRKKSAEIANEQTSDKNDEWWEPLCNDYEKLEISNKMMILLTILCECEARNEKLIVFSSCLSTLNVIEHFLSKISDKTRMESPLATEFKGIWIRDLDYSRLDGTQSAEKRKRDVTRFNKETNTRTRLFLISTKAGGLGINLMAANRVVIFDASWNPSDDIQSIFRTYRIGQTRECYIYRFIALGTMEEKIYDRQITKLSIAKRVIDEHQIGRHYKEEDLQQLYCVNNLDPPTKWQPNSSTKDNLLNSILRQYQDAIYKHHDHDSLLENVTEEILTDEEVGDVWEEFE